MLKLTNFKTPATLGTWKQPSFANVSVMGCFAAELAVGFVRHRMDARCIDPTIIEIEQCANRNREIDRFVGPANIVQRKHVVRCDCVRFVIDLGYETKEPLVFLGQLRVL